LALRFESLYGSALLALFCAGFKFSQEGLGNKKEECCGKESCQDEEETCCGEESLGDEACQEGFEEEGCEEEREGAQGGPEASSDFYYTGPSGSRSRACSSGSAHTTTARSDSSTGNARRSTRDSNH
jgi:hypothetical protein